MLTEEKRKFLQKVEEKGNIPGAKFVWIYRGEGEHEQDFQPQLNSHLSGCWYTESYSKANNYRELAIERGARTSKVLAVVTTQDVLDSRDVMLKGMNEIIIMTNNINPREVSEEISEPPTKEDYKNQFIGYSEYKLELSPEAQLESSEPRNELS